MLELWLTTYEANATRTTGSSSLAMNDAIIKLKPNKVKRRTDSEKQTETDEKWEREQQQKIEGKKVQ